MMEELRDLAGHNLPPSDAQLGAEEANEMLRPHIERRDQFVRAMTNAVVRDRGTAGQATDLLGLARGFYDTIQTKRHDLTRPRREAISGIIAAVESFLQPIVENAGVSDADPDDPETKDTVYGKLNAWQRDEAERVRAQRQEQADTEAALRAAALSRNEEGASATGAPAPAGDPLLAEGAREQRGDGHAAEREGRARLDYSAGVGTGGMGAGSESHAPQGVQVGAPSTAIRGDLGYTLSKGAKVEVTVEDVTKVPLDILRSPKVIAEIEKIARARAKDMAPGDTIPGIKIKRGEKNRIS